MGIKKSPLMIIIGLILLASCTAPSTPQEAATPASPLSPAPISTPAPAPLPQPIILEQLEISYPELYQELLRLPELRQTGDRETEAIEDIIRLALNPSNKAAFESMLVEGIKDKRQYCTPLQALLWIAYDMEFQEDYLLKDYSLERLLKDAWENTLVVVGCQVAEDGKSKIYLKHYCACVRAFSELNIVV